jgi:carbonic anhydrase
MSETDQPLPTKLLKGYANFRAGRYRQEESRYRDLGAGLQKPSVMIIACCDSRASPETIFDAGPGAIFYSPKNGFIISTPDS